MFASLEHLSLIIGMLYLLHLDHLLLLQHFDGVVPLIVLGLDQVNSTKTTGSQRSLYGEVC